MKEIKLKKKRKDIDYSLIDFDYKDIEKLATEVRPKITLLRTTNKEKHTKAINIIYNLKNKGIVVKRYFGNNVIDITQFENKNPVNKKEFYKLKQVIEASIVFLDRLENNF